MLYNLLNSTTLSGSMQQNNSDDEWLRLCRTRRGSEVRGGAIWTGILEPALALLGVRLYSNWVILMFRKATGPWSPWKKMGPVGCSGVSRLTLVPWATSTFSCTNCPFRITLRNFAFDIFFPVPSNLGARKSMSNCCHSPAFLQAFNLGALSLYTAPQSP